MTPTEWFEHKVQSAEDYLVGWKKHFEKDPKDAFHFMDDALRASAERFICKLVLNQLKEGTEPLAVIAFIDAEIGYQVTRGPVRSTGVADQAIASEELKALSHARTMLKDILESQKEKK